ncbi:MAG: GGDEF domain-containing protein [Ruminiclostridium sp.]|nr:GGDEF domain-containing protein [Ruminiclostridium sp.]
MNYKNPHKLSFSFGILFALFMAVVPAVAGIIAYAESTSEYSENISETVTRISTLLKAQTESVSDENYKENWLVKAEQFRAAFSLPFISLVAVSDDNSQLLHIADAVIDYDPSEKYMEKEAAYYTDVSQEVSDVFAKVRETGEAVSREDIFGGKYGKVLVCYTSAKLGDGGTGIMCVAADTGNAENKALLGTILYSLILEAAVTALSVLGMRYVTVHCTSRLRFLSQSIEEYTRIKDPVIADNIRQNTRGSDEISVLSLHTASMITELQGHIDRIMKISGELLTANERAEKFSELARKDALTGLENKLSYYEKVKHLDEMIQSGTAQFAVIVIDLNYLKRINDEYGHNEGDAVLKKLADNISDFFGSKVSYRIGGDEFAVIIEGERSHKALALAANFRNKLADDIIPGQLTSAPSAAVGCSNFRAGQDTSVRDVFERADNEMYGNKIQMKAVRKD